MDIDHICSGCKGLDTCDLPWETPLYCACPDHRKRVYANYKDIEV